MKNNLFINPIPLNQITASEEIYQLFQMSYAVEAKLAQVENFPPLLWKPSDIEKRKGDFWGHYHGEHLIGLIQAYESSSLKIEIHSLVVHPNHFKCGIGSSLLSFLLGHYSHEEVYVETAASNVPAISLYQRLGFKFLSTYNIDHIEKIKLILIRTQN